MYPTRPWLNYLWNDEVVASADQFGNGFAWTQSGTKRRDLESGTRNVYVFDPDSKELYSATRNHGDLPFDSFRAIVGLGYHRIISSYKGLEIAFTILVPTSGKRILYRIEARNVSKKRKDVTLFFVNEPRPALSCTTRMGRPIQTARASSIPTSASASQATSATSPSLQATSLLASRPPITACSGCMVPPNPRAAA